MEAKEKDYEIAIKKTKNCSNILHSKSLLKKLAQERIRLLVLPPV